MSMKKKIIAITAVAVGILLLSFLLAAGIQLLVRNEDKPVAEEPKDGNVLNVSWYNETDTEFVIRTAEELREFSELSEFYTFEGQTIRLENDIVLNEGNAADWAETAPANRWAPVSNFAGTFDGQGHTISGLYARSYEAPMAMFENTSRSCVIRNVKLVNSYIETGGASGAASFVARGDGKFYQLYSEAVIVNKGDRAGGIIALTDKAATLEECWFAGSINSTGRFMGGIVGTVMSGYANIKHCLFSGSIYSSNTNFSWETVDGVELGGLCGSIRQKAAAVIDDSYVSGLVSSAFNKYSGAVVGLIYTDGTVVATNTYTSTVVAGKGAIGDGSSHATSGPITMNISEMTGIKAYQWTTLDFENYWAAVEDSTPVLKYFAGPGLSLTGIEKEYDLSWYKEEEEAFTISNLREMYGFALLSQENNFKDKTIRLGNDIVVNEGKAFEWAQGKNLPIMPWFVVGSQGMPFAGTFDGQGHTISGVYYKAFTDCAGVFASAAYGSTIQNLKVKNCFIDASGDKERRYVGGVIGATKGNLDTIYSDSIVHCDGYETGGIVGYVNYHDPALETVQKINNCWFNGRVAGASLRRAGGVIGTVTYQTGGLDCHTEISNCLNTGTVISERINSSDGFGGMYVGGLIGYVWGGFQLDVRDCLNVGSIAVQYNTYVGSFIGYGSGNTKITMENCYTTKESYQNQGASVAHGGFSKANRTGDVTIMPESILIGANAYKYTMLDFSKYWGLVENDTPVLLSFAGNIMSTKGLTRMIDTSWYSAGKKSFVINSVQELYGLYQLSLMDSFEGKTITLGADVNINSGWTAGESVPENIFFPISRFAGTFDGNNRTISGVYIQEGGKDGIGLFDSLASTGTIRNLILENSYIESAGSKTSNTGWYTGGLVGLLEGGNISGVYVKNDVIVRSNMPYCGGIVGNWQGDSTISCCWFAGIVDHNDVTNKGLTGGIVGGASKKGTRTIENCLNTGTVIGYTWDIGGLIGGTPAGEKEEVIVAMKNSVCTGEIVSKTHNYYVGSLIGGLEAESSRFSASNVYTTDKIRTDKTYRSDNRVPGFGYIKKNVINGASMKLPDSMLKGVKAYTNTALDFWSSTNTTGVWAATGEGPQLKRFSTSTTIVNSFANVQRPNTDWYYSKLVNSAVPEGTTFELASAADFFGFAQIVNLGIDTFKGHTVRLTKSIDLNPEWTAGTEFPENGNVWSMIGSGVEIFNGTFDGGFHTIRGIYIYSENSDGVGMFTAIGQDGKIKNLKLENSYIESNNDISGNNGYCTGSFAGIMNGTAEFLYAGNDVKVISNKPTIGGLIGKFDSAKGQIANSWFSGTVTGTFEEGALNNVCGRRVGGIIGTVDKNVPADKAVLSNCIFDGIVYSYDYIAGGLVGLIVGPNVKIENCLNDGTVYAGHGGRLSSVVGYFEGASASAVFTNVYTTGRLYKLDGSETRKENMESSGNIDVADRFTGGYTPLSAEELKGKKAYVNTELDFWSNTNASGIWAAIEGTSPEIRKLSTAEGQIDNFDGVVKLDYDWYYEALEANPGAEHITFEIATISELAALAKLVNGGTESFAGHTVKLTSPVYDFNPDWVAGEPFPEDGNVWMPVGKDNNIFKGTFTGEYQEGGSAVIRGIYVEAASQYIGLFGDVWGNIQNLKLENSVISSTQSFTGGIVGRLWSGNVKNIFVADTVTVKNSAAVAGGIVGRFSYGRDTDQNIIRGGRISNCWFAGEVIGNTRVGGIVGQIMWTSGDGIVMDNCLFNGIVRATDGSAGGLVGHNWDNSTLQYCVSNGRVCSDAAENVGAVVGESNITGVAVYAIEKVFKNDGTTENMASNKAGYKAMTEAQLTGIKAYKNTDLDFYWKDRNESGIWTAITDAGPELKQFSESQAQITDLSAAMKPTTEWYESKLVDGKVKAGTVFEIASIGELTTISRLVAGGVSFKDCTIQLRKNGNYELNAGWDARMMSAPVGEDAVIWTPIGSPGNKFEGTFDGNGATVKGIYVSQAADCTGFFGYVGTNGTVKNLRIENSYIKNEANGGNGWFTGSIAGKLDGGMDSVQVGENVIVSSKLRVTGGLIGQFGNSTTGQITNCWFAGKVIAYAQNIGGLVGRISAAPADRPTLKNCLFTGEITAWDNIVGGLVNVDNNVTSVSMENCLVRGMINARYASSLGAVSGYNTGAVKVDNVYSAITLRVLNADGSISGTRTETSPVTGVIPVTEEQIKGEAAASSLDGFDFYSTENPEGVWVITDNGPELKWNVTKKASTFLQRAIRWSKGQVRQCVEMTEGREKKDA